MRAAAVPQVLTVVSILLATGVAQANAAVRSCAPPVLGDLTNARSELEARRGAIASWRRKALRSGRAYTSWRLAVDKRAKCAPLKDGRFACVAFARPCRIQLGPNDRRGLPSRPRPMPMPVPPKNPGAHAPRAI